VDDRISAWLVPPLLVPLLLVLLLIFAAAMQ
jgi:hypothetical protein